MLPDLGLVAVAGRRRGDRGAGGHRLVVVVAPPQARGGRIRWRCAQAAFAEACAAMAAISTADVRDAAVLSSLILRKYLATAAGDPALFETHEEFVARHDALQRADSAGPRGHGGAVSAGWPR